MVQMLPQASDLIIASRESRLAMWQAEHVQALLQVQFNRQAGAAMAPRRVSILGMTTVGDQRLDRPLSEIGGKGLFTKELEVALVQGRAHLAVHSLKDVPMELAPEFQLSAVMVREDPRDAFVSNEFESLSALPSGAKVGTSSLRRAAQLRAKYPHLQILPLRGNLDTRLGKLDKGEYDAIILATAGLKRLGLGQRIRSSIEPSEMIPSPGQGALGLETLSSDKETHELLQTLVDGPTTAAVLAERAVSRGLGGNCKLPLAAHCFAYNGGLKLMAMVSSADGKQSIRIEQSIAGQDVASSVAMGEEVAAQLIAQGALQVLAA
jgi:hydroxymethylbilane synthase